MDDPECRIFTFLSSKSDGNPSLAPCECQINKLFKFHFNHFSELYAQSSPSDMRGTPGIIHKVNNLKVVSNILSRLWKELNKT